MKIIITGATGFVGENLHRFFDTKNYELFPLSLRSTDWISKIPKEATALIHLAGKAHDTSNSINSEDYFKVNRDLTIDLYNVFLKSNVRDFFYFSSVKAVADNIEGKLTENVESSPLTPYGKSKLEAEQYLLKQKLPIGKRLFIIRPCMIHGPGNKGNLNLLYKIVEKGIPWPLASYHNQRSFLSIENLSYLIDAMIRKVDLKSAVYNFSDDDELSTNELVELIAESLGRKVRLWAIPPIFIKAVAKAGDIIHLPLNSERLKKLTESYIVSNDKIKNDLKIDNLPLSSREGIKKTVESFKHLI